MPRRAWCAVPYLVGDLERLGRAGLAGADAADLLHGVPVVVRVQRAVTAVEVELVDLSERGSFPTDRADLQGGQRSRLEAGKDHRAVFDLRVAAAVGSLASRDEAITMSADRRHFAEQPR